MTLNDKLTWTACKHANAICAQKGVSVKDDSIIEGLVANGGYCPCRAGKVPCPCPSLDKAIEEGGACHCGLFTT